MLPPRLIRRLVLTPPVIVLAAGFIVLSPLLGDGTVGPFGD